MNVTSRINSLTNSKIALIQDQMDKARTTITSLKPKRILQGILKLK